MTSALNAMKLVSEDVGPSSAVELDVAKTLIRRQMNQGGNILLSALEPLNDAEFYAGGANGISPAWTLGHLACVLDLFTSWMEGRDLSIPRWIHETFNSLQIQKRDVTKTKADSVDPKVLPKADIMLLFRHAQVHAIEVLKSFDMRLWDAPTPANVPDNLPTYGAIWQSLGVHPFWHLGELSGCIPRFHGTYTLNTVSHYFYTSSIQRSGIAPSSGREDA